METKYAGIFINAFTTVLESFTTKQVLSAGVNKPESNEISRDISVMIEIVGDIQGKIYMTMNESTGMIIASEMLGGMEVTEVDEMVTSAISELCNMVLGNACQNICTEDISVDITPPAVVVDDVNTVSNVQPAYNIIVIIEDFGSVNLNVSVMSA